MGARNRWADRKKENVRANQMDGSWAGSISSDGSGVTNHCCRFLEHSSSRCGFVTAAVGHSTPMTFCLTVDWYFLSPLNKCMGVFMVL